MLAIELFWVVMGWQCQEIIRKDKLNTMNIEIDTFDFHGMNSV